MPPQWTALYVMYLALEVPKLIEIVAATSDTNIVNSRSRVRLERFGLCIGTSASHCVWYRARPMVPGAQSHAARSFDATLLLALPHSTAVMCILPAQNSLDNSPVHSMLTALPHSPPATRDSLDSQPHLRQANVLW